MMREVCGGRRAGGELGILAAPFQNPNRRPRRHDERDGQREEHRRAGANGNRPHVGAHQPADKRHRQHCRDHGEGGEDGGIADFVHGLDGDGGPRAAFVLRQVEMADDVFHHHDGVVHQDADGEDQREERDAVERVAVEIEDQQRQRQRAGNGDANDHRFAPAEREKDQQRHANDGDAHVEEEFVGLFLSRLAVVAGDGDLDVRRDFAALERLDFAHDFAGHADGVGAGAFGDAEGDGRLLVVGQASRLSLISCLGF